MAHSKITLYVGTYTDSSSKGIYRAAIDPAKDEMILGHLAGSFAQASFLALHPKLPVLYAVSEQGFFEGRAGMGGVGAFLIGNEGMLTPLGAAPSGGEAPCYVSVTPDGHTLLVANYGSGTIASFRLAANGAIESRVTIDQHVGRGPNQERQDRAHAHCIVPDLAGAFALAANLGTDTVYTYRIDAKTSALELIGQTAAQPGSGPRHIAFHPRGEAVYVVDELANNVTTFHYQKSTGVLSPQQTLGTLPTGFAATPSTASEVAVHPSGKFVYVANRGHDSIAIFATDEADGTLTRRGHALTRGKSPRHFAIDLSGQFMVVANQKSDSLTAFRIDSATGELAPARTTVTIGTPACIRFVRD